MKNLETLALMALSGFFLLATPSFASARVVWDTSTIQQVLAPGSEAWENVEVWHPNIMYDGGVYKMWYAGTTGRNGAGSRGIGYAISTDGLNWTNRQLVYGPTTGFYQMDSPNVRKEGDTYKMWFREYWETVEEWSGYVSFMTSADGISWSNKQKVMGALGRYVDGYNITNLSILSDGAQYIMWYAIDDYYPYQYKTWRATSPDGITWAERQLSLPYLPGRWGAYDPNVTKIPGAGYIIFYTTGYPDVSGSQLATATSWDGITWSNRREIGVDGHSPFYFQDTDETPYLYFSNGGTIYRMAGTHVDEPVVTCVRTEQELQDALNEARNNAHDDVIQIVQGTYLGNFVYSSVEPYGLTIEGGYTATCASREVDPENTVLDAQNSGRVLELNASGAAADVIVDGLTMQHGNISTGVGAALRVTSHGSITIGNNVISNSLTEEHGGGLNLYTVGNANIFNNSIHHNKSRKVGGGAYITGAYSYNLTICGNSISDNESGSAGGGLYISLASSSPFATFNLTDNMIANNASLAVIHAGGGGVDIDLSGDRLATLSSNVFVGNTCGGDGGGLRFLGGMCTAINNLFHGNVASMNGGGIYFGRGYTPDLINNTLSHNTAGTGGGIWLGISTPGSIYNNIIWNNHASVGGDLYILNASAGNGSLNPFNLLNNDFDQSSAGTYIQIPFAIDPSNLNNVDPLFVDSANSDYRLHAASPCINAGTNDAPGLPSTDKEGLARIIGGTVDIGAYEYQGVIGPITVSIDIKPGSYPNSINLKSKGVVPVAILTTYDFDVRMVDPFSVLFVEAPPRRWHYEDVDRDGHTDLLFHFETQELMLDSHSTEAMLTGNTLDGDAFEGTDSVNIVPKCNGKK